MVIVISLHGSKMCIVERLLYEFFEERWDEFPRVQIIYQITYQFMEYGTSSFDTYGRASYQHREC